MISEFVPEHSNSCIVDEIDRQTETMTGNFFRPLYTMLRVKKSLQNGWSLAMWGIGLLVALLGHASHGLSLHLFHTNRLCPGCWTFAVSSVLYCVSLHWISPSACANIFALLLLFALIWLRLSPLYSCVVWTGVVFFALMLISALVFSPPSYDSIGTTELIHLCTSPVGVLMCLAYVVGHLASWLLATRFDVCWSIFAGYSLGSLVNIAKLVTNLVSLTIRIENQWRFPFSNVIVLALPVASAMYVYGVQKLIDLPLTAVNFSLFFFVFATATIASATIVFGDPIMLRPIPLTGFLTGSIGEAIAVTMIGFGCLPVKIRPQPGAFKHFQPEV
jgi:hypothetical protein